MAGSAGTRTLVRWALGAVALAGMGASWWVFPEENRYSIMTHTISFLGSPDVDRNPPGWRYYQVGMTAALVLLLGLAAGRRRMLGARLGRVADWTWGVASLAMVMMLVSVWVPDARSLHWGGVRLGDIHNAVVVPAILLLMGAIVAEGIFVGRKEFGAGVKWAYRGFGILFGCGLAALVSWEVKCARTPGMVTWPGEGIHSTPLWEWLLFGYLLGFSLYLGRGLGGEAGAGKDEG